MGNLLKRILESFGDGLLNRLIKGAGISLVSGTVILTVINFLINKFMSDFMIVGDLSALVGISGLDQCISIIISAFIARAMITSSNVTLAKA